MFRSLTLFNYRAWFFGALISNIGAWMQSTALAWIVLTVLTENDAGAVGINMALQFGPQLLLVPISGLIADKFDRRKILLMTQTSLGLLAVALAAITVTGVVELWMVQIFAFAFGVTQAIDAPARQAFVSQLVGRKFLPNAVALNSASFHGARLIGPAVAGVSIAIVGPGWVFALNALTFAAMIIALLAMRTDELEPSPRGAKGFGDIVQGLKYVRRRDDILIVMLMAVLLGTFGLNFQIFISTMTLEFDADAEVFGVLSSAMAVGSVTGALLSARSERPKYSVIIGGIGLFAVGIAAAAWAPNLILFAVTLAVVGFFAQMFMTNANSMVQLSTAPEMRGRVMALYSAVFMGGTPIGAPLVGYVANELGARWGVMVASIATVIGFAFGLIWWIKARRAERMTRTGTLTVAPVVDQDTRN
ncbi:MAG: MFS transporter [Agrococcus casei]|uniref:MFS transporter n=2 Tax=Agrococcus casei TaxID=343512 RepID=UPI003F8E2F73